MADKCALCDSIIVLTHRCAASGLRTEEGRRKGIAACREALAAATTTTTTTQKPQRLFEATQ